MDACSSLANRTNLYQSTLICGSIMATKKDSAVMTCTQCGAYLTPSVRFCSSCGAPASDPEATRIARLQSRALEFPPDSDLEQTVFTVRPTMVFVKAGYALAVVTGIALVFLLAYIGVPASISIPLALALLLI